MSRLAGRDEDDLVLRTRVRPITERQLDQLAAERIANERLRAASTPKFTVVPRDGNWTPTAGKVWDAVPTPFDCEKA